MSPPVLEVLAAARHTGLAQGTRVPVTHSPFELGRTGKGWQLSSYLVSRRHAVIERGANGEWTIEDLGSTNGTLVNGKNAAPAHPLRSGDFVDLSAAVLRFVDGPLPELPVHRGLEETLRDNPFDEAPWRVWADWLLEEGHPLGAWLQAPQRPPASSAQWLGPLARRQLQRRITTTWHPWGLLLHLRLPFSNIEDALTTEWTLRHLHLVPGARFLASLEVEVPPQQLNGRAPTEVFLQALQHASLPTSLRTLRLVGVGDDPPLGRLERAARRPPPAYQLEEAYLALRRSCPRLTSGVRELVPWPLVTER